MPVLKSKCAVFLVAFALLFSVTAIGVYWYVGLHGFSARDKPTGLEEWLAKRARRLAIPPDVRNLKSPVSPTPLNLARARDHFADHCALCHANNGAGNTVINSGLYPPAPDMRSRGTQDLTDGEILYIIKNGIRFTGMPGWGGDDGENWKLVLFIRHLPELTPQEIQLMNAINHLEGKSEREHSHSTEEKESEQHTH
jgi:mono/diheme cytochrome c family protein